MRICVLLITAVMLLAAAGCAAAPATDTGTGIVSTEIKVRGFEAGDNITIPVSVYCSIDTAFAREIKEEYVDPGDTWETTAYFKMHQTVTGGDIAVISSESSDRPVIIENDARYIGIAGFNPDVPKRRVQIDYPVTPTFTLFFQPPDHPRDGGYEYPAQQQLDIWLPAPIVFTMVPGETKKIPVTFYVPEGEAIPERMAFFASLTTGAATEESGSVTINYQNVVSSWILLEQGQNNLPFYLGIAGIILVLMLIVAFSIYNNRHKEESKNEKVALDPVNS